MPEGGPACPCAQPQPHTMAQKGARGLLPAGRGPGPQHLPLSPAPRHLLDPHQHSQQWFPPPAGEPRLPGPSQAIGAGGRGCSDRAQGGGCSADKPPDHIPPDDQVGWTLPP